MTPGDNQIKQRFRSKISIDPSGCHLWTAFRNPAGYGHFRIEGTNRLAHRVAWLFSNGPIPDGMRVCHRCDTPACVNPDHLFLGTDADNVRDMMQKGRHSIGEAHPPAKLSVADVIAIRGSGDTQAHLAKVYGVSQPTIWRAKHGANWKILKSGAGR
jgi:hypothetical protein